MDPWTWVRGVSTRKAQHEDEGVGAVASVRGHDDGDPLSRSTQTPAIPKSTQR